MNAPCPNRARFNVFDKDAGERDSVGRCYETHWEINNKNAKMAASEALLDGLHRRRTPQSAHLVSNDIG